MRLLTTLALALLLGPLPALADLPATVARIKPSIVAIGTYQALRGTPKQPLATGFVVGGKHAVTNSHVVPDKLDEGRRETLAVYLPAPGNRIELRAATLVARDREHDLAVLRFDGAALPSLTLGRSADVREGEEVAFTGFPILNALGLHPATHRALIAAISPVAIPVASGKQLNRTMLERLSAPFDVFQLDAVAYPGNSGSPLYEPDSGRVIGVINSVHVKRTKESAIRDPSGISYAIPVDHLRALLRKAGVRH